MFVRNLRAAEAVDFAEGVGATGAVALVVPGAKAEPAELEGAVLLPAGVTAARVGAASLAAIVGTAEPDVFSP